MTKFCISFKAFNSLNHNKNKEVNRVLKLSASFTQRVISLGGRAQGSGGGITTHDLFFCCPDYRYPKIETEIYRSRAPGIMIDRIDL